MKARNPSTGTLETVYVKALDSMPVGTEVDFDGTSADIPIGWEQVNNVLYDRTGVQGPNYNKTDGLKGSESLSIDMSSYKRIKVYGYFNVRKYQFVLEIDITDALNIYEDNNKYWGRALVIDNILSNEGNIYDAECTVSQNKQTFKVENISFRTFSSPLTINSRNSTTDYVVTKIIGYKEM